MSGLDRDIVDFRNVGRDMEDHETDDTNALSIRFGLGDKAGYKTVAETETDRERIGIVGFVIFHIEDHETDDTNALSIRFGLGDKAGYKTVVIEQPIIAVDGPVRKMLPGALDVDDPVDVAFASLTNSDFQ